MDTKKLTRMGLSLATAAAIGLVGCAGAQQPQSQPESTGQEISTPIEPKSSSSAETVPSDPQMPPTQPETAPLAGGWDTANATQFLGQLSNEEAEIFNTAISQTYPAMKPSSVIATQLVSGTNYAFLCTDGLGWHIAVVYVDLNGNATLTSVEDIEITDIDTVEPDDRDLTGVGAWVVSEQTNANLPEPAAKAFSEGAKQLPNMSVSPVALLGQQLVSGTNYMFLCSGVPNVENPVRTLYIVTVYENLQGEYSVTSTQTFNLLEYID